MRKPPRPTTLLLGLALIAIVIWKLFEWGKAPPRALEALLSAAPSASSAAPSASSAAPSASPPRRRKPPEPGAPLALLSASASVDAAAALGAIEGSVVSSASGKGIAGARILLERGGAASEV